MASPCAWLIGLVASSGDSQDEIGPDSKKMSPDGLSTWKQYCAPLRILAPRLGRASTHAWRLYVFSSGSHGSQDKKNAASDAGHHDKSDSWLVVDSQDNGTHQQHDAQHLQDQPTRRRGLWHGLPPPFSFASIHNWHLWTRCRVLVSVLKVALLRLRRKPSCGLAQRNSDLWELHCNLAAFPSRGHCFVDGHEVDLCSLHPTI